MEALGYKHAGFPVFSGPNKEEDWPILISHKKMSIDAQCLEVNGYLVKTVI